MKKSKFFLNCGFALGAIGAFLLTMDGFHITQDSIYSIGDIVIGAFFIFFSYRLKAKEQKEEQEAKDKSGR